MTTETTLTQETMTNVRRFLSTQTEHRPDAVTYEALKDIALTMEAMAYGKVLPKVYLSSLDPGSGKTVTITQFVKCLIERSNDDANLRDVGVIIFLSRREEIRKMVKAMDLQDEQYACLTSKDDINGFGLGFKNIDTAQVLFTTQKMLESRLHGGSFKLAKTFFYQGKSRSVRIWDESFLPGRGITISEHSILELSGITGGYGETVLADALKSFSEYLQSADTNNLIQLPDFKALLKTPVNRICKQVWFHQSKLENTLKDLIDLSGTEMSVICNGGKNKGVTIVSFKETLPADLAPILVTDASGRVRYTYDLMEKHRQNIVRLKVSHKLYLGVPVAVWLTGGGKSSWIKNAPVLTDGIARTINKELHEKWLIIYHDPDNPAYFGLPDLSKKLPPLVNSEADISFLTWGQHTATNVYRDCSRIILAGTLFYNDSQYEGLTRAASSLAPSEGAIDKTERNLLGQGESKHNILQAACRGSLRVSNDVGRTPCKLFIIAGANSGIKKALTMPIGGDYDPSYILPGCTVENWDPIHVCAVDRLTGYMKDTFDHLKLWANTVVVGTVLGLNDLRETVGANDAKGFNQRLKNPTMIEALETLGLFLYRPNSNRVMGVIKGINRQS